MFVVCLDNVRVTGDVSSMSNIRVEIDYLVCLNNVRVPGDVSSMS